MNRKPVCNSPPQTRTAPANELSDCSALLHSVLNPFIQRYAEHHIGLTIQMDVQAERQGGFDLLSSQCLLNAVLEIGLVSPSPKTVALTVLSRRHNNNTNLLISACYAGIPREKVQTVVSYSEKLGSMVEALSGELEITKHSNNSIAVDIMLPADRASLRLFDDVVVNRQMAARLKVLLVDDNCINRKVIQTVLNRIGIVADEMSNGLDAINAARARSYDVIFMDCILPGFTGIDVVQQLVIQNIIPQDCIVAAITAAPSDDVKQACQRAGMQYFIAKPVLPSDIVDVVNEAVRIKQHTITPHSQVWGA